MFQKKIFALLISVGLLTLFTIPTLAQDQNGLTLSLRKDFGYDSFPPGKIQGAFTMRASGPADLARVVFMIDGNSIGEVAAPPFNLNFDTSQYTLGKHTLSALGFTTGGKEIQSNQLMREFVSAGEGPAAVGKILLPILGVVVLVGLISFLIPTLFSRGKRVSLPAGAPRSYSPLGGAICPKCGRPFGIHAYGLNMVIGKFDRCPYCGKWSLVRRASQAQLQEAEAAELREAGEGITLPEASPEEKLRKDMENSRYQDL